MESFFVSIHSDTGMPKRSRYNANNYMNQGSSSNQGIFLVGGGGSGGGSSSSSSSSSSNSFDASGSGTASGNGAEVTLTANDEVRPSDEGGSNGDQSSSSSSSSDPRMRGRVDLTSEEVVTLCCGVLFFISFFVAMYAQVSWLISYGLMR